MAASDRLRGLIRDQVADACGFPDEQRDALLAQIKGRYREGLLAVLIYGSYLRGKRDTLLDFYVLLDSYGSMPTRWHGWLARALPPNVYQIQHGVPPDEIRAKYALLTLDRFEYAVRKEFHSYFWARFAQPCGILYCRDEATQGRLIDAFAEASATFARRVVPGLPAHFDAKELWTSGLTRTYQCEFRSEPPGHAANLFDYWPQYYRAVTGCLAELETSFEPGDEPGAFLNRSRSSERRWFGFSWWLRRVWGKVLSTLRIVKAALTFDGALDYLLWKIKRHSGIYIEPTPLQRRYPILFAWPLLWRLWRRGAFQ
jgi:hypothetical protein